MSAQTLRLAWLQLWVIPPISRKIVLAWLPLLTISSWFSEYNEYQDSVLQQGTFYGIIFMYAALFAMVILTPEQFFYGTSASTSTLTFPFTLPTPRHAHFRARLVLLLAALSLPTIGPLTRGFAAPDLYLQSIFDQYGEIELMRNHYEPESDGGRQLRYLERLPQAQVIHLQTSEHTQQVFRLRRGSLYSGATLHIPNGRRDQVIAQTALYLIATGAMALAVIFGASRWSGYKATWPGSILIFIVLAIVIDGGTTNLVVPSHYGERIQVEMMRTPWAWLSASIFASAIMLFAAERLWLRREEL